MFWKNLRLVIYIDIGMADTITVNSKFTWSIFKASFKHIPLEPLVLYPGLHLSSYDSQVDMRDPELKGLSR